MIDINADNLEVWRGPFSWDGLLLRLHIRTVKLDYDAEDPRTWPLIKDVIQTEVNCDYRQTKPAPRFLAYEQSLIENLITHRPLVNKVSCRPNLHGKQIKVMSADYPFNFDGYGEMRKSPHIPADELKEWIKLMKGTVLDAKYILNISTPSRPAPDRRVEARGGQATGVTTDGFNQVLKMMNETSKKDAAEVEALQKEVSRLKIVITQQTVRVDKAEKDAETAKKAHKKELSEASSNMECVINDYEEQTLHSRGAHQKTKAYVSHTQRNLN
ncbi:hypothetical protein SLS59_004072 [Nothophoma quercina]|uniref:Uncharacterized protein n=1 Tax=Nothophoma quercina TaxID=749835 RepID=A0ABR3RIS0_9PLEO